ncbi:hydroxyalkanoic acid synthase [Bacillus sp. LL01]|uniref:alpha/beta fold hydrolase n=1 Tax=Bacillus sp. LL01 TaxID=1665556 RepID=UPI00064D59CE|nr:alpha/beta fold hydrolase [Bacillus sp. LL01]KMJ58770.1 hydroxyalkanoic acid synthase [Bacillus sp. LL01]
MVDNQLETWKKQMMHYNETPFKDGVTPRKHIWKKNKATLWYYKSPEKKYNIPIFIIYSLINQPFILDLQKGGSTIEALVHEGYDVYLIDYGKPGLEDRDMTLNDYITKYIQSGVKEAIKHSGADQMSIMGYCLGGTLAAIYASIAKEPIKNLVLFVTPIDFATPAYFDKWVNALRREEVDSFRYVEELGIIPASHVEAGIRMVTSPVYLTPYLSLLLNGHDKAYVEKWHRFNTWTKGHIPLTSGAAKQITEDLTKENKVIKGLFEVNGQKAKLSNIKANLLVVGTEGDRLVPLDHILPIMEKVSSVDKQTHILQGGHTGTSVHNGKLPVYLQNWLAERSDPIDS